ncbi:hypothetical protein OG242_00245 [Streptomyces sp. NBC_00727]|uniref:hypothetical protein n=1 Tax=Streptomyces sp. NBC_00727 TaxID=2903675 RepID=UPI003867C92E
MNEDDLAWQAGNYKGLAPRKVGLLLEREHLDLVIRAAVERGEWFCAERAVRELCESGEFARALAVMEPFVMTGWAGAVWAKAGVLLRAGRTREARELVLADEDRAASPAVCRDFAELLAIAGRVDEAIELLVPHVGDPTARTALVHITEGTDHDEQVLALLSPDTDVLRARVLERSGRNDEALRVLGAAAVSDPTTASLTVYAEALARHGRLAELRELAERHPHDFLDVYAGALWDRGRAAEAETVMREVIVLDGWVGYRSWLSTALLHREGRLDDAIAVAEPGFSWYDCSNLLAPLVHLLLDKPEELLRLLDHPLTVPHGGHEEFQHWWRAHALADLGRIEEALAVAETDPNPWTDPGIIRAGLLSAAGDLTAAATELRGLGTLMAREELFEVLVRQGQAAEGIAVHPTVAEQRAAQKSADERQDSEAGTEDLRREGGYAAEPPF